MAFWNRRIEPTAQRVLVAKSTDAVAPESKQVDDPFAALYGTCAAIEPPLPPLQLISLTQISEVHAACLGAKMTDSVGRGYSFEPVEEVLDPDEGQIAGLERRLNKLNSEMTFLDLLCQAVYELEGIGWSGWEVARSADKQIAAIYPIPAHTIRATNDPQVWVQIRGGETAYFRAFGAPIEIDRKTGQMKPGADPETLANEVIIFRRYSSLSDYYGVPSWVANMATLAELGAIGSYNREWFESAGVMSKLIGIKSSLTATAVVEEVTKMLRDARGKAHRSVVFELPEDGAFQVEDVAATIQDAKFQNQRRELNRLVLIAHQVPPYRVGWAETGSLGGSAAREMLKTYSTGVVEPIQRTIEHRLRSTLFGEQGFFTPHFEFTLADVDTTEEELDVDVATRSVEKAILTPNEARQRLGLQPSDDPEMDRFYYGGVPIDTDGATPTVMGVVNEIKGALQVALRAEEAAAPAVEVDRNALTPEKVIDGHAINRSATTRRIVGS